MDLGLTQRVALVAGSSRGIGKAVAIKLLDEGARVCLTGRDEPSLNATVAELLSRYSSHNVFGVSGDLTDSKVVESVFDALQERWGGIDILVANLGSGSGKTGWNQSVDQWERLFQLNFWGSVRLAQSVIPRLIQRNSGCIVFVSSIVALEMTAAPLPYSAAKAALLNYSKNLAGMLAADHIRVNSVAPGNVLFPGGSWDRHLSQRREQVEEYISTQVPMQRFGTPEEIAALIAFLCSPQAAFSTGACYVVDGGQTHRI